MSQFECDLDPETLSPRVRFNFANGWTASLLILTGNMQVAASHASIACWPTGACGEGKTENHPGWNELGADEVTALLAEIANRPAPAEGSKS